MYKKYSVTLKEEQKNLENKMNEIKTHINNEEKNLQSLGEDEKRIYTLINKFCNLNSINGDVVNEFIEKIFIDKDRKVHVKFKFKI